MKEYFIEKENVINTSDTTREVNQIIKWKSNGRMSIIVKFQKKHTDWWETYAEKKVGISKDTYSYANKLISMSEADRMIAEA